jgi:hypothetical protein
MQAPLSDIVIIAVSRLVDDAQGERRDPSHADIEYQIDLAGLAGSDPNRQGQTVGKAKRVRATLYWALENAPESGGRLVAGLLSHIRGCGGFRDSSANYVGAEAVQNAVSAFGKEGFELSTDGELQPLALQNLSGAQLTAALEAYVRRARQGITDASLVTGTGKDLLEATAAHILMQRYGSYSPNSNFPTLLGQAFIALGLATSQVPVPSNSTPEKRLQRALFDAGCAVNSLRNKQGTGHGRPWPSTVTPEEARIAVEMMGTVAEYLLLVHKRTP